MRIMLSHGDGGSLTHELVAQVFRPVFGDERLEEQGDAAVVPSSSGHLAISTDSFVVQPLEFPGGDIGTLAVAGTVNDLAVSGAVPEYLSVAFVLEEGLEMALLRRIAASLARTAAAAGVRVVAGDTKVVERGKGDGIYLTTTGVGRVPEPGRLGFHRIRPGDHVVVSGGLAEHAVAVLCERAGIRFDPPLRSDCRPLNQMIQDLLAQFRGVRFLRDPTRGGVATTLKEVALGTGLDIQIEEGRLPVRPEVGGALELLGMEPWYLANEGKVLIIVAPEEAGDVTAFLREYPGQELAADIGCVSAGNGDLWLKTPYGGRRSLGMLSGTPLPRIC